MELYLQIGWGMMSITRDLITDWGEGTAILSPRDLEGGQIISLSECIRENGGNVLLDPQFYIPGSDHFRLTAHDYWPEGYDNTDFRQDQIVYMVERLEELSEIIQSSIFIVPGERAESVDARWIDRQTSFIRCAREISDRSIAMTVCLSSEALRSDEQVGLMMEHLENIDTDGFYLVFESPGGDYLVNDPVWLANAMNIAAGLRRIDKYVIVGYCSHQGLIMSCAGINAIASGNWRNTRSFSLERFRRPVEGEIRQKAIWYYCPQALNEYTLAYLDIGFRLGFRQDLIPEPDTQYTGALLQAGQPSLSEWSQADSFKHYLSALRQQVRLVSSKSFNETVEENRRMLDRAEELIQRFRERGIRSEGRNYGDVINANLAAISVLESTQGITLQRDWPGIVD